MNDKSDSVESIQPATHEIILRFSDYLQIPLNTAFTCTVSELSTVAVTTQATINIKHPFIIFTSVHLGAMTHYGFTEIFNCSEVSQSFTLTVYYVKG